MFSFFSLVGLSCCSSALRSAEQQLRFDAPAHPRRREARGRGGRDRSEGGLDTTPSRPLGVGPLSPPGSAWTGMRAGCCCRGAARLAPASMVRRFRPLLLLIVALSCGAHIGNSKTARRSATNPFISPSSPQAWLCLLLVCFSPLHSIKARLLGVISLLAVRLCWALTIALSKAAVQQSELGSSFSSSLLGRHSPVCPLMAYGGGEEKGKEGDQLSSCL